MRTQDPKEVLEKGRGYSDVGFYGKSVRNSLHASAPRSLSCWLWFGVELLFWATTCSYLGDSVRVSHCGSILSAKRTQVVLTEVNNTWTSRCSHETPVLLLHELLSLPQLGHGSEILDAPPHRHVEVAEGDQGDEPTEDHQGFRDITPPERK